MKRTNSIGKIMLVTLLIAFVASVIVEIIETIYGADVLFTVILICIPLVFVWIASTTKA
jgi:hypothetical protein